MLKLNLSKAGIRQSCTVLRALIKERSPLVVLQSAHLAFEPGAVVLRAWAGGPGSELTLRWEGTGQVQGPLLTGAVEVKALIGALDKASTVELDLTGDDLQVVTDVGSMTLAVDREIEGNCPAAYAVHKSGFRASGKLLVSREALDWASQACASNSTPRGLNRIVIDLGEPKVVRVVTTDGFRLAYSELAATGKGVERGLMALCQPSAAVLRGLLAEATEVAWAIGAREGEGAADWLTLSGPGWQLCESQDGRPFPSYMRVVPASNLLTQKLVFPDRKGLLKVLETVGKVRTAFSRDVELRVQDGVCQFIFENGNNQAAKAKLDLAPGQEGVRFALKFNWDYLKGLASELDTKAFSLDYGAKTGVWRCLSDLNHGWRGHFYLMPAVTVEKVAC